MGDYKSQYEKYYSNMNNKKKNNNTYIDNFIKKLIIQLSGALVLFGTLLIIKAIPLEETKNAYIVSKDVLNKEFNINETVMAINIPEFQDYKERTLDFIDNIKTKITGQKSLKEKIKEEFIPPVIGKFREIEEENGVVIENSEVMDVLSSSYGIILEIESDADGYHILMDNGNGIETFYGLLSEISVKEGDKINKSQCIGKTSKVGEDGNSGVVFKIIYFGKEKNPWDLLDFSELERV